MTLILSYGKEFESKILSRRLVFPLTFTWKPFRPSPGFIGLCVLIRHKKFDRIRNTLPTLRYLSTLVTYFRYGGGPLNTFIRVSFCGEGSR